MSSADTVAYTIVESPLGPLTLTGRDEGLTTLELPPRRGHPSVGADWRRDDARFADVADQLGGYFAGGLKEFDVALAPAGTPFQRQVWDALTEIPYGATASYGEVARRIGRPSAARAVGQANNRNPIAIIIPCHRVIGASGSLTGYGGGLDRKRLLLDLEAGTLPLEPSAPAARPVRRRPA